MSMKEIWKPIKNYEGLYEISNLGRVKSLRNKIVLKNSNASNGYLTVTLCNRGDQKTAFIHRLVAMHFISNDDNGKNEINHIDENSHNNIVDNLEWCTRTENNNHGTRIEKQAKSLWKPIIVISPDGEKERFQSIKEAAKQLNLNASKISTCLGGKQKTHRGFKFLRVTN